MNCMQIFHFLLMKLSNGQNYLYWFMKITYNLAPRSRSSFSSELCRSFSLPNFSISAFSIDYASPIRREVLFKRFHCYKFYGSNSKVNFHNLFLYVTLYMYFHNYFTNYHQHLFWLKKYLKWEQLWKDSLVHWILIHCSSPNSIVRIKFENFVSCNTSSSSSTEALFEISQTCLWLMCPTPL